MPDPLPTKPGWYLDPYQMGFRRFFDGSRWTTHAVPADVTNPDAVVAQHFDGRSDDERRLADWENQFPWWDPYSPKEGESTDIPWSPNAVLATRIAARIKHRARALTLFVVVLVGFLAAFDQAHRDVLLIGGAVYLVLAAVLEVYWLRQRARRQRVGRGDVEPR